MGAFVGILLAFPILEHFAFAGVDGSPRIRQDYGNYKTFSTHSFLTGRCRCMTLTSHFNLNAVKQKKEVTEDAMRTGVRKDSYGNSKFVRNGKIQRIVYADGSRDTHGAEIKQKNLKQQAEQASQVRRERARHVQTHRNSPRAP
jgi:hypothetical protein